MIQSLASRSHEVPRFLKEIFPSFFSKAVSMQRSKPANLPKNIQLSGSLPLSTECNNLWKVIEHIKIKGRQVRHLLDSDDRIMLMNTYRSMYPDFNIILSDVYEMCFKLETIIIGSHRLSCNSSHESRKCIIMANWCNEDGNITSDHETFRPGQIQYFLLHNIKINDKKVTHIFCAVNWYSEFKDDINYSGDLSPSVIYRPRDKIPSSLIYASAENKLYLCIFHQKYSRL